MKRYDIEPIEASDGPDVRATEYSWGAWVKYEDANDVIYDLECKIEKLTKALNKIHDVADSAT